MRRLATLLMLVFATTAVAPIMACLTGAAMSSGEASCCRTMHGQCGEMAKTGCCEIKVRGDDSSQVAATPAPNDATSITPAHLSAVTLTQFIAVPAPHRESVRYLPPGRPRASFTILRI